MTDEPRGTLKQMTQVSLEPLLPLKAPAGIGLFHHMTWVARLKRLGFHRLPLKVLGGLCGH